MDNEDEKPTPRALRRRDSEGAADRALTDKFPHLSVTRLHMLVNKDGKTASEVVAEEQKRIGRRGIQGGKSAYLPSEFWTDLQAEFDIHGCTRFEDVPNPVKAEAADVELYESLQIAKDKNPALRNSTDFSKYLEYADTMNSTEFFGCLHGVKPQVNLSLKHQTEMQQSLLKFVGAKKLHLTFEDMWKPVHDHFEIIMKEMWVDAQNLGRPSFIAINRETLAMFLNMDLIDEVEEALAEKRDPPYDALQQLMASPIGSGLYAAQGVKLNWMRFLKSIDKGLEQPLYHDFLAEELTSFNKSTGYCT